MLVSERRRKTVNYLLYSLFHSLLCKHRDASIGTVGIAIYKLPTGPCRRQLREEGKGGGGGQVPAGERLKVFVRVPTCRLQLSVCCSLAGAEEWCLWWERSSRAGTVSCRGKGKGQS